MQQRVGAVARLWWLAAGRRWRRNAIIPVIAAALWLVLAFHTFQIPRVDAPLHGTVLFSGGLLFALFLPSQLRGESLLASTRWVLLPYTPRWLWTLRPLFGDPLRILLVIPVVVWGTIGVFRLDLGPFRAGLETAQLVGWAAAGVVIAEVADELLRRRVSLILLMAQIVLFAVGLNVLLQSRGQREALWGGMLPREPWSALLLGGAAPPRWEALAVVAALVTFGGVLAAGRAAAEYFARTPPPARRQRTWGRAVAALGRGFAPGAPASLTKEIAALVRIPVLRLDFFLIAVLAGVAGVAGTTQLLAGCFGLWFAFAYNLLGPDVPAGGLERLRLLRRSVAGTMAWRHAAVVLCSALVAGTTALLVTGIRGRWGEETLMDVVAGAAWFAYGASLFLLVTLVGDRMSLRNPRAFRVHFVLEERTAAGGAGEGIVFLLTLILVLGVGAAVLLLIAALLPEIVGTARLTIAAALAALLHTAVYAVHLRVRLRDG